MDRWYRPTGRSVNMNMMIFVVTMFLVPLGFATLYLYVSEAFSKHTHDLLRAWIGLGTSGED